MSDRDPDAWAIYVRATALDGAELMRSITVLGHLVDHRGGHIAGIYADVADRAGPEMGVLLGHAVANRFGRLAVVDAGALGDTLDRAAHVALALYDVGVALYAYRCAGTVHPGGATLTLDRLGRDVLGVAVDAEHARMIDVITSTVGTAHPRRHSRDPG